MSVDELQALERELEACLARVLRLAKLAGAEWHALVEGLTGEHVALPPIDGGANPAEVRAVLLAMQAHFEARLQLLERHLPRDASDELSDAIWTFRHRRLSAFVSDELAAYVRAAAPRPRIASVFAAAARPTAAPVRAEAEVQLHRCATCGAPRHADGLYGSCLYCGHALFNPRQEID